MVHNYYYSISNSGIWSSFNSLTEARQAQRRIIKSDKNACFLYRDELGYYIAKKYIDGRQMAKIR